MANSPWAIRDSIQENQFLQLDPIDSLEKLNEISWKEGIHNRYSEDNFDYSIKEKEIKNNNSNSGFSPLFSPDVFGSFITFFYFLFKIVLIASAIFLIYWAIKYFSESKQIKKSKHKPRASVNLNPDEIEDIHEIDFAKEIKKAQDLNDFRLAIRWSYLWTLKKMDDKQLIEWQPKKTNQDYTREIKSKTHKKTFKKLTYIFDYTWFGKFNITQSIFENTMKEFSTYRKTI